MDTGAGFSCYFFWIASMASITAARRPPRSSAATPTMVVPGELLRLSSRRDAGRFLQRNGPGTRYHLPCQAVGRRPGQAVQHRGAATPTMVVPPGELPRLSSRRDAGRFLQKNGPGARYHLPCQAIGRRPGQAVRYGGLISRFEKSPKKRTGPP